MRKIINILLLLVIVINTNAYEMKTTSSYIIHDNYNSTYNYNTNSTANYNSTYNYGYSPGARIGYTTGTRSGWNTSYQPMTSSTPKYTPRPRRSPQRPFSGNFLEDLADWWRMITDSDWPGYVDEDYWDEFLAEYPEYEDEAREWYENQGMHFPGDPDDPYPTPIGGIEVLFSLLLLYFLYLVFFGKLDKND